MKRIFFAICIFLSFVSVSCINIQDNNTSKQGGDNTPSKDEDKTSVRIVNNSQFNIDFYSEPDREIGFYLGTIEKGLSKDIPAKETVGGSVYYITYHIDLGVDVPWYNNDSYIVASPEKNKTIETSISDPKKMDTYDAFVILENNTNDFLILKRGQSGEFIPDSNKTSSVVDTNEVAVYRISSRDFLNLSSFSIYTKNDNIPLQKIIPTLDEGSIYTVTVNGNGASLKSITPFDINVRNKIWSLDNSIFSTEYPVAMRPSYDGNATLVIGTARREPQKIGIGRIDEYGKYSTGTDNFVAFNDNPNHTATQIVDFVEQQDGSVVMLCNQIFKTGDIISENYVIVCYDFATKTPKWYKVIPSSVQVSAENDSCYMLVFRNDSKNKLIQIGENKFVCVGAYDNYAFNAEGEFDYDRLHYMIMYIDGTNTNSEKVVAPEAIKTIISTDYSDLAKGIERNLTSAYFDGTDLFICGYENWNHPVKNEKGEIDDEGYNTTHVGKIWKVSPSDIEAGNYDFENNVVYSCDNCLFFSIDGTGSNYVVCGEYKDTGKVLKGCHVTSSMIKADSSCTPVKYTVPGKQSCWFNQLCQYGSKIVLCGKAADSFDGSESPLPFVVAYDSKGNKLWENLSFTNYTSALNIIPNTIGTYMLQLEGKNGIIHYVNADLLGNEKK